MGYQGFDPICAQTIWPSVQEAQLMLTNPSDAFRGQSRSPWAHTTSDWRSEVGVWYSFLLCNSNFVFKKRRFSIFDFKNIVTLKSGSEVTQGHWQWYHLIDCVWFPISVTSYWRSIVTMALFRVVSEIFNVEKCCDLGIEVKITQGNWN